MTAGSEPGRAGGQYGSGPRHAPQSPPTVNAVALASAHEQVDEDELRERAWSELLRQEAVRQGLLAAQPQAAAPALSAADRHIIETMIEQAVQPREPTDDECRRAYDAHRSRFVEGAQVHARHILFAVTTGVDVQQLAARAEQALLELTHKAAPPGRFEALARELSNCPSALREGDLGWFGPHECAPELARELFHQQHGRSIGLRPRLVHSRYGFHILEVLERRPGRQAAFEEVRPRIAALLAQDARAKALHQYMRTLAAGAEIAGLSLPGTDSPLVQ